MYLAQLCDNNKCSICYVENIDDDFDIMNYKEITGKDVIYNSSSEEDVIRFCEKWNKELKYYTYEDIKSLTKGKHIIVLLAIIGNEYIGLAQQDKSYKIKINDNYFYEKYYFLVCTKVLSKDNDYLIPIGCSDEFQWVEQEEEYKRKLCSNETFNKHNEVLKICKQLKYEDGIKSCWNDIHEDVINQTEELEDIKDNIMFNYMLYKVVKRCYEEAFPIQEYRLFEIPYSDKKGWIMDFVHGQDYDDFHIKGLRNIKFREIDFYVEKNGIAIPQFFNPETSRQWNAADCISAVWYEQNGVLVKPKAQKYYIYKLENGECGIAINKKSLPLIGESLEIKGAEAILDENTFREE